MFKVWKLAIRDLGRNKRRSALTLVAVALGLALLVVTSGLVEGAVQGSVDNNIRVRTAHVQVRSASYDRDKLAVKWEDLIADPQSLAERAAVLSQVRAAMPVLWANGILATSQESVGIQVYGIVPGSEVSAPFRQGLVAGGFLAPDDRNGILVGRRLAEALDLNVDSDVSLLVDTADGQPDEAIFTIRGLYDTGIPTYDEMTVFMPLAKAQAFARTGDRASALLILLHDQEKAEEVAAAIASPGLEIFTWRELNETILAAVDASAGIMFLMYLVVLAVVAVVIANTLLMSVFERTREMGILAALGMKGREVMAMFVTEAGVLALLGIVLGLLLGSVGIYYLATTGIHIGDVAKAATAVVAYGETLYGRFVPEAMAQLAVAELAITLLGSLYPAWFAARMEPIEALRAG